MTTDNGRIETIIINQLIFNREYFSKCVPFISEEYFDLRPEKIIVKHIESYFQKYDSRIPDPSVLKVMLEQDTTIGEKEIGEINEYVDNHCSSTGKYDYDWLLIESESFCQEKAVYNGIVDSINIIEGRDKNRNKEGIPEILSDALGVNFDVNIGHDYFGHAKERFESYNNAEAKFPCGLEMIDKITHGGFEEKTINLLIGGPGCVFFKTKIHVRITGK